MEKPLYHVLLAGRRVGPYDRRTIVGMRVKKALKSDNVLVAADGSELTVSKLVWQQDGASPAFTASRSGSLPGTTVGGSHSVVQGIHAATLLEVEGRGFGIPPFEGEVELRRQTRVLRLAGRFREGTEWREERVKFPPADGLSHASPRPGSEPLAARPAARAAVHPTLWGALAGATILVGGLLVGLLARHH